MALNTVLVEELLHPAEGHGRRGARGLLLATAARGETEGCREQRARRQRPVQDGGRSHRRLRPVAVRVRPRFQSPSAGSITPSLTRAARMDYAREQLGVEVYLSSLCHGPIISFAVHVRLRSPVWRRPARRRAHGTQRARGRPVIPDSNDRSGSGSRSRQGRRSRTIEAAQASDVGGPDRDRRGRGIGRDLSAPRPARGACSGSRANVRGRRQPRAEAARDGAVRSTHGAVGVNPEEGGRTHISGTFGLQSHPSRAGQGFGAFPSGGTQPRTGDTTICVGCPRLVRYQAN